MIWILYGLGAIAALVALLALVGTFLPRDHVARAEITLAASPDRVWALVSDFGGATKWRSDLKSVELEPQTDGSVRWVEVSGQGRMPFELVSQNPPTQQVVRVVDDGLPFGGTWTWDLAPAGAGTRVTIEEAGFVRNPIFRAMGRVFFKPTDTMIGYLKSLAAALGDSATPTVTRAR